MNGIRTNRAAPWASPSAPCRTAVLFVFFVLIGLISMELNYAILFSSTTMGHPMLEDLSLFLAPRTPTASELSVDERVEEEKDHVVVRSPEIEFLATEDLRELDFFSSAFWQSVPRFVGFDAEAPTNIEGVTFHSILHAGRGKEDVRMPRDWLYFSIEHLSKWWRLVGDLIGEAGLLHAIEMLEKYSNRTTTMQQVSTVMKSTVALIPFHLGFDANKTELWERMDQKALTATIVSVLQYGVGRVVVVGNFDADANLTYQTFEELGVLESYNKITGPSKIHGQNLTAFFETKIGDTELAYVSTTDVWGAGAFRNCPKGAVKGLQNALKRNSTQQYEWLGSEPDRWKFVYHTEPDQILNGRPTQHFLDVMNEGGVIIPHRLQPIPHWQDFESVKPDPRAVVGPAYSENVYELDSSFETADACCDVNDHSGIDNIGDCKLFWWQCGFGHGNFSSLVHNKYEYMRLSRGGGTGIVLLAATEHGRKCRPQINNNVCQPVAE